ncbi:hypothetical protein D3C78_1691420 [compost metagenome]
MEEIKIKAYRTLLYQAFIDIRVIASKLAFLANEMKDDSQRNNLLIFHISNAFHNVALSLAEDPYTINEEDFWSKIMIINKEFPDSNDYIGLYNQLIQELI